VMGGRGSFVRRVHESENFINAFISKWRMDISMVTP
jgi:hypothetical protein